MSVFLQPIYTQTVGSGGAASISFSNIPQTFTDLVIKCSLRVSNAGGFYAPLFLNAINGASPNIWSDTLMYANPTIGPARNGYGAGTSVLLGYVSGETSTSNTFSSNEIYIPNYTSSNYKQIITEGVTENNSTSTLLSISGALGRTSSGISSITLYCGAIVQYSTVSLYGVLRQGI